MESHFFEKRLQNLSGGLWTIIAQIDGIKGQWIGGIRLVPQVLGNLKQAVLITSSGASTRIEGARLSDDDVKKLVHGLKIKTWAERDRQEVQGYYEILQTIFNAWESIPFSENSIKHLHQEMLKYVEKDKRHRGDYKKRENRVIAQDAEGKVIGVIFAPTPAYLTPKAMQELVEWTKDAFTNKTHHPLLLIANFLVEFLKIHPFQDGNGRLSRILTNLLLLKTGYAYVPYVSHEKLIEEKKPDYYLALRASQKTSKKGKTDITAWLAFFLSVLHEQASQALSLLEQENVEQILSVKQLKVWQYLQSVEEATPAKISRATRVALPTVRQALGKLLHLQKVERLGLGRGTRYRKI